MKKLVSVILVMLLVVMCVGCSNSKPDGKYVIGIVQPVEHTSLNEIRETIVSTLQASEYADKIEIVYKNGQGDGTNINTIVTQFVGDKVDMIIPITTGTAQIAAAATTEIPIVFAASSTPVEAGLVASMDDTSGNITGVSDRIAVEATLELAEKLTPGIKTFGLIYNQGEVNAVSGINRAKAYLDANGYAYIESTIAVSGDLLQATQSLVGRVEAIYSPNCNTTASAMPVLAAEAINAKLPVYVGADSMVIDGGFATVGIDYKVLGKQVAEMAIRIMNGESIADNNVEVVKEHSNLINTTTAEGIGVTLPQDVIDSFILVN